MKALSTLFLAIFIAFSVNSQSLFFRISDNGLKHPVYIFGTIHVFPASKFFIHDIVLDKLRKSEKLVLEIDLSDANLMLEIIPFMAMQGKTLSDLVTLEEFELLNRFYTDSLEMPFGFMVKIKPLLVSSMMIPYMIGEQIVSYEDYLKNKAKSLGIPVGGLETIEEQIGYIDRISLKDQARLLVEQVRDIVKTRSTLKEMFGLYLLNDAQVLYDFVTEHSAEIREFSQYLLAERNQNWISQIIKLGSEQPTFVAIGAGHLGGERGVINLLKQAGYMVEPL